MRTSVKSTTKTANPIRMLVLDVLKPHQPTIIEYARALSDLDGIEGVNISVGEVDSNTETVKISLQGSDINFDILQETVTRLGGTVHSIDKVGAGVRLISEIPTSEAPEK